MTDENTIQNAEHAVDANTAPEVDPNQGTLGMDMPEVPVEQSPASEGHKDAALAMLDAFIAKVEAELKAEGQRIALFVKEHL